MPLLLIYSLLPRIEWCSTNRIYLKKLQSQQKHEIFHEIKFAHTWEHFKENNTLDIYQLNIFNNLLFLHRVKNKKTPHILLSNLRPSHHYPTTFSQNNYIVPSFKLTKSKYRITIRAPKLRNIIFNIEEKLRKRWNFQGDYKDLVLLENAILYFRSLYKTINSST